MEVINWNIVGLVLLVFFLTVGILQINQYWKKVKLKRRFSKASKAEQKAEFFLMKKGFRVIEDQYRLKHVFQFGKEEISIDLKVDYLVKKGKKTFLVEVKSGESAPSIYNKDTRRQLIEYALVNPFDGIFLLDMQEKALHPVKFNF